MNKAKETADDWQGGRSMSKMSEGRNKAETIRTLWWCALLIVGGEIPSAKLKVETFN